MAIPTINKQIRRQVVLLPEGELIVALLPSNQLTLGIKSKPTTKKTFDLLSDLWAPAVSDCPPPPPVAAVSATDVPSLAEVRTRVATTQFSDDPKVNAGIIAKFDSILHNLINPVVDPDSAE